MFGSQHWLGLWLFVLLLYFITHLFFTLNFIFLVIPNRKTMISINIHRETVLTWKSLGFGANVFCLYPEIRWNRWHLRTCNRFILQVPNSATLKWLVLPRAKGCWWCTDVMQRETRVRLAWSMAASAGEGSGGRTPASGSVDDKSRWKLADKSSVHFLTICSAAGGDRDESRVEPPKFRVKKFHLYTVEQKQTNHSRPRITVHCSSPWICVCSTNIERVLPSVHMRQPRQHFILLLFTAMDHWLQATFMWLQASLLLPNQQDRKEITGVAEWKQKKGSNTCQISLQAVSHDKKLPNTSNRLWS